MLRMPKRRKTYDILFKEWGMLYHCHSCDKSFKTAPELDKHIRKKHKDKRPRRGWKRRNG